jgi:hypothetical protein
MASWARRATPGSMHSARRHVLAPASASASPCMFRVARQHWQLDRSPRAFPDSPTRYHAQAVRALARQGQLGAFPSQTRFGKPPASRLAICFWKGSRNLLRRCHWARRCEMSLVRPPVSAGALDVTLCHVIFVAPHHLRHVAFADLSMAFAGTAPRCRRSSLAWPDGTELQRQLPCWCQLRTGCQTLTSPRFARMRLPII